MFTSFTQMPVWKTAHNLSVEIYNLTIKLPRSEDYGLTSQIRRAANSVSANIAEGYGRKTSNDKSHFYTMAKGSACETQNHLLYGCKTGYFEQEIINRLIQDYDELMMGINKIIKILMNKV